jgi:hypothetical protein
MKEHITKKGTIFWYVMLYSVVEAYVSDECAASMLRLQQQAKQACSTQISACSTLRKQHIPLKH